RYFLVPTDTRSQDYLAGLSDSRPGDFTSLILVKPKVPRGIFTLGAMGATALPQSYVSVPVWLASQHTNPRLTEKPERSEEWGVRRMKPLTPHSSLPTPHSPLLTNLWPSEYFPCYPLSARPCCCRGYC